jgi:hypothetical protein
VALIHASADRKGRARVKARETLLVDTDRRASALLTPFGVASSPE